MSPRLETREELKCRPCGVLVPTVSFSYSQKKRKHRRRCPTCVKYFLYLRGDGPKVAKPDNINVAATHPHEYGQIQLAEQLLPAQKLSGVSHLKTIVVERRAHTETRKTESHIPLTYQNSTSSSSSKSSKKAAAAAQRKSRAERDVAEEELKFEEAEAGFAGGKKLDVEEASTERFTKLKKTPAKPKHERTPSSSDQARALYLRQLSGRKKIRASRDFDNEEETPELLKGEKGRKRLSVLEGGYPRPSMKPGRERVVGGN